MTHEEAQEMLEALSETAREGSDEDFLEYHKPLPENPSVRDVCDKLALRAEGSRTLRHAERWNFSVLVTNSQDVDLKDQPAAGGDKGIGYDCKIIVSDPWHHPVDVTHLFVALIEGKKHRVSCPQVIQAVIVTSDTSDHEKHVHRIPKKVRDRIIMPVLGFAFPDLSPNELEKRVFVGACAW